jgi:DMSO reductase anchor subunit
VTADEHAVVAADDHVRGNGHRDRRRSRDLMGRPEFTSYYGRPILKPPVWEPLDIAGYLFLGGLAGASSALAAGAELRGMPGLARVAKVASASASAASIVALVHDLGRPARFLNMLRVLKPTSPMSVGSWLLGGFVPVAGAAALSDLTGRARGVGALATGAAAAIGPAVAAYTGVLLADTAIPAWHDGYREMPFVFVASGAEAAAGVALAAAPLSETGPARRLAVVAPVAEVVMMQRMHKRLGMVGEPYRHGKAGAFLRASQVLTLAGVAGALAGRRSRLVSALSGVALTTASACTRFAVFHAGVRSAEDPKYTVVPQRERLAARGAPPAHT